MIEFSTATELLYSYSSIDLPEPIFFEASGATQATEPHRIFTENLAEQPHLFRCLLQFCKVGKYYSWLNTATLIIQQYNGAMPLAVFLKNFFSTQKKYGSKDRRQISALCYSYFRLGKLAAVNRDDLNDNKVQSLILAGLFLCSQEDNALLAALKPHWHDGIQQTLADKYATLQKEGILPPDGLRNLFPWPEALSTDVDQPAYNRAYLIQPLLFLRIRPGFKEKVIQQLQAVGYAFQLRGEDCVALPNQTKVEDVLHLNRQVVVQDHNSQKVGSLLHMISAGSPLTVWDCCAASGGKSILAVDILGSIRLTVSDIRESILANLKQRFEQAGIYRYKSFVADLSQNKNPLPETYDLVICDAPCTGSGTWARTPEQLRYFTPESIISFQSLQQKIVSNTLPAVKKGGYFLYITCSVFRAENEEMATYIQQQGVQAIKMELLPGWATQADSMFAALFHKA